MKQKNQIVFIFTNIIFLSTISIIFSIEQKSFNIEAQSKNELTINDTNLYEKIIIDKNNKYNLYFNLTIDESSKSEKKYILLTILGSSLNNFEIKAYNKNDYLENFPIKKCFYNGYAIIISNKILSDYENLRLELQLKQFDEEFIYIRTRRINKNNQSIKENNHTDIVLEKNLFDEECFSIINFNRNNYVYALNILTYTKNIIANFKSFYMPNKNIEINKESFTYIVKNEYNEICFNLDDIKNRNGSLSIEFINLNSTTDMSIPDKDNIVIYNAFILVKGLPSENYLPKGNAIFHKIDIFKEKISFINVQFHIIKGKPKLFIIQCENYPFCKYSKEDFETKFKEYENINGYVSIKKEIQINLDYGNNNYAVVYCPNDMNNNEDCKYEISMKNEDELTCLYKDKNSYSFVNSNNENSYIEKYKIFLENDLMGNDKLYINVNIFSGRVSVKFLDTNEKEIKDYQINYFGNKIEYIFNNEVIEKNTFLYINITKDESAYFSVNYEFKNENNSNKYYLEEGILQYGKTYNNLENYYYINDYHTNNYPFIININTYGNKIRIKDANKNIIINNTDFNLIQIIINEKKSDNYLFSIIHDEINIDNEDNNLYSISLSSDKKILMSNGQLYINQLNNNNKEVTYIYTFNKKSEGNKIILNFRKFSKNPVKLNINNKNKEYIINRFSKIILLNDNDINNICDNNNENLCKISIKIKNADVENSLFYIDFSIQLTENDNLFSRIFLPQNILISNLLIPNYNQNYYVQVPKNGIGKIYIDFMEGGGYANATLINQQKNDKKEIYFNYFNKYFEISEDLTKNCDENDCKIYINLSSNKFMYKYNIYSKIRTKNKNMNYFLLPEYEYIYGNLQGNEIHYYKTKITKEANKIIFNIFCDNCQMTIKYNEKSFKFDTFTNKEYILDSSSSGDIDDFYGITIYYSLQIKDIQLNQEQNYNLRIMSSSKSSSHIIPSTSLRNEYCKISINMSCYYIIPIEKYNTIDKIKMFIPDNENAVISHTTMDYNLYDEYDDTKLIENIKNGDYKNNNKDKLQKNYYEHKISRETGDKDFEKIYIFKIELNYSTEITIISSYYNIYLNKDAKLNLQLNDYSLIYLDNKTTKNMSLIAYNIGFYDIQINLIKGKGKINIIEEDSPKKYILNFEEQDNLNLLVESKEDGIKEIEAEVEGGEDVFIIYIKVGLCSYNNNLEEIKFQKNNYFNILDAKSKEKILPLNFYMKLNITSQDLESSNKELKNINLNYKFTYINNEKLPLREEDCTEENIDIKIYLVNREFINKRKINSNKEEKPIILDYISNYRIDTRAGYSLIKTESLIGKQIGDDSYLYIEITPPRKEDLKNKNKNINIMFSAFDLTDNFFLPMNEYLTMLINQNTKINLAKKFEIYNNLVIELVIKDNIFNFSIISEDDKYYYNNNSLINGIYNDFEYYGKSIINKKFVNNKNNILYLFNKSNIKNENITQNNQNQNLLIKYRISNTNKLNYFNLSDGNIKYYEDNKEISFTKIKDNNINLHEKNSDNFIIYNIRIYNKKNNESQFSNNILNNEKPLKIIKLINPDESKYKIKNEEIQNGFNYISILAEARKGNIYEYLTYNPLQILYIPEQTNIDIIINKTEGIQIGAYSKSFIYNAKVEVKDGDYIKLSLKHKNYLNESNFIYVGNEHHFINSENLYENSDFKTIERNTSLIIPINKVKNSKLFIRIPCNDICDFVFKYIIYKKENIVLNDDDCFDFEIINNEKFIYNNDDKKKIKKSLFTITSYSVNTFNVSGNYNQKELEIDKTYFNGYSFIFYHIYEEKGKLTFTIEGNSIINICHRTLERQRQFNNDKDYEEKDIVIGDKIYIGVENYKNQCFKIYKKTEEAINNYILNFISKTKNIFVNFNYSKSNILLKNIYIKEESNSIFLDSSLEKFCISIKSDNDKDDDNTNGGLLIHLLSFDNNNLINQNLNMPLIKGISTRQILKKGQILYYRINENAHNSKLINIHFQNIISNSKVYHSKCDNFPKCSFSSNQLKEKKEHNSINNNIFINITIDEQEKDIYHKSKFPVVIVYCTNEDNNEEFCHYYIEMSNDNEAILLNENRKIYSYIQPNIEQYEYKFSISKNNFNLNRHLLIQIFSFTGSVNIEVNKIKHSEDKIKNYYRYNNNTEYFIYKLHNNKNEYNIIVNGEKNSYYNIFYFIIDESSEDTKNQIYLPIGEVHYNVLLKPELKYYYYFQDKNKKTKSEYLISINPINCDIYAYKDEERVNYEKNNQFLINSNESIIIYYKNNSYINDICEYTISAVEDNHSRDVKNFNELIITDGLYQNYQISKTLKFNSTKLKYLISKEDINDGNIIININKNSNITLIAEYSINNYIKNKTILNYNEIICLNLKDIYDKNNNVQELNKIIFLKILIHLGKRAPQDDCIFKIKINGKNVPSYLYSEEIEYGLINKGQYLYYYFNYNSNERYQIIFDCKGKANFNVASNINKNNIDSKKNNYIYYNNKYNLPQENIYENNSNYNYINIDKCEHNICQVYITIFISKDSHNEKTLFNIYRHSEKKEMNVLLNQEIYGVLYNNISHKYYTDINFEGQIKIVLKCKKCKMCYNTNSITNTIMDKLDKESNSNCENTFEPSKDKYLLIQNNSNKKINKINYMVFSENQNSSEIIYYSIYVYNNQLPKYINQNEPEICETPCKLILPIYQFYYYNKNHIILYIPDDEQVIIYEKIIKMDEIYPLNDFDIESNNNKNSLQLSLISNKLIINTEEIKNYNDNIYIQIQINSKLNKNEKKNITFISSQFYNSLNEEIIPYFQNIFIIDDNISTSTSILNNILKNLNNNKLYKIDISLIEGSGLFILNNNNQNINYSLSYDTQEIVSFILKYNNSIIKSEKNKEDKNFCFYININEKENNDNNDELIFRKTNYMNYFKDNKKNNIFPINLKLQLNDINDLHINLHFSKLLKENNSNETLINVTNEIFDINIKIINEYNEIKELKAQYYCDLRRAYIYLDKSHMAKSKFIEIIIEKNEINKNLYEHISLEITPFDLNYEIEIPRNNYLQMKINNNLQNIKLSKPLKVYKNTYIELSSSDKNELSFGNNISYSKNKNINGKSYYSIINNNLTEYIMTIKSNNANNTNKTNDDIGTILLKYITKKDTITQFNLKNSDINWTNINSDNDDYNFKFHYSNIKNNNKEYYNYNLSYLIRLYNSFSFENDDELKKIFVEEKPIFCFRKELNELELKDEEIEYGINFGKLQRSKYYISILGEVVNDTNIDYFTYNFIEFTTKRIINEAKFDYSWIIIIIILFLMLIFVSIFLVKVCINLKNNKKNDKDIDSDSKNKHLIIKSIN